MKKFTSMAIAFIIAIMFTAPAMAIQADFSGYYRLRGWNFKYVEMRDAKDKAASESYMRMRLRVQPKFTVSENLSLTTRFDAFDNAVFGDYVDKNGVNVDFERAYITAKTPIGGFLVGRMSGGAWGTIFGDLEDDADRLIYVVPIDKLTLALTYEKALENNTKTNSNSRSLNASNLITGSVGAANADGTTVLNNPITGDVTPATASSEDNDKYYLSATYKAEGLEAGLLFSFYNYKSLPDMEGFLAQGDAYGLTPYIIAKFGDFGIEAELSAVTGEASYDSHNNVVAAVTAGSPAGGAALAKQYNDRPDHDISMLAYYLQASYNLSPVSLKAGYAFLSGDSKTTDDEEKAWGYISSGRDFNPLFILTGWDYDYLNTDSRFAGLGQQVTPKLTTSPLTHQSNRNANTDGYKIVYGGVDFKALDNLTVGIVAGTSRADETTDKWSNKHGEEYDLNVKWKIMDNLTYNFIAAMLNAGDYWKKGSTTVTGFKDPYVVYNELKITF